MLSAYKVGMSRILEIYEWSKQIRIRDNGDLVFRVYYDWSTFENKHGGVWLTVVIRNCLNGERKLRI